MTDPLFDRLVVAVGTQYLVDAEIGRGGMAVVYSATDLRLHRRVAIKVLPPELAFNAQVRERFLREAQTAAQLAHPGVVPIYMVDETHGLVYFVMALVEGESLAERLARDGRLPISEVRRVLSGVADALAYAHSMGVVHRDVKPDNIMLDRATGRPLVTDFGIARAAQADSRLTVTGVAIGTPAYMSPEQALGERELDGRSDIYSLGVIGYQMLAGETPFKATNTPAMLMKHVAETPREISTLRPDTPSALAYAITRALAKKPEERWPDANLFRDASLDMRERRAPAMAEPRTMERHGTSNVLPPAWPVGDAPVSPQLQGGTGRPVDVRIVSFQRKTIGAVSTVATLAAVNLITSPDSLWFLYPTVFIGIATLTRIGRLYADGIPLARLFTRRSPEDADATSAMPLAEQEFAAGKLAPPDVLAGAYGEAVRYAAIDRASVHETLARLSKTEREMIPDVAPTIDALSERIGALAITLHRLDADVRDGSRESLAKRLATLRADTHGSPTPDQERRIALLERQRATIDDLTARRTVLIAQLDSATLALRNLRLDLSRLRSSGVEGAMFDVASATQEARALSRDIGNVVDAVREVKQL